MDDRRLLLGAAALRATGTSLFGVLLGIYLAELGHSGGEIGAVSAAGLAGAAAAALAVTFRGDRWGRRRTLVGLALLGTVAGAALLFLRSPWALAGVAFLGMANAMGRDRGASAVIEQASLPATVPPERRTLAFAWYAALQDSGHALGSLLAGLPALLAAALALSQVAAGRATLALYPLLLAAGIPLYLRLSPGLEVAPEARRRERDAPRSEGDSLGGRARSHIRKPVLSPETRRIVTRISLLFGLDGIGGGFLVTTLLSYYFFERFDAAPAAVALLFFAARLANLLSNFGAAWLARRFGLVNTMVFTHIPASLLLMAVAFVPTFAVAAALFLLREMLVEMDVPTRQSYVMAVVEPEERTAAAGVTNLVRLGGWAAGPALAGWTMEHWSLGAPLLLGAAIKIVYDLLLWTAFRRVKPPEERLGIST